MYFLSSYFAYCNSPDFSDSTVLYTTVGMSTAYTATNVLFEVKTRRNVQAACNKHIFSTQKSVREYSRPRPRPTGALIALMHVALLHICSHLLRFFTQPMPRPMTVAPNHFRMSSSGQTQKLIYNTCQSALTSF